MHLRFLAFFMLTLAASIVPAAERVHIITGPNPAPQETLAAGELADQFRKLFEVEPIVATNVPAEAERVVLVGGPQSNPAVKDVAGGSWPRLSDQGLVLRSFHEGDRQGLIVAGGSPTATLWAAYELGHRYGIRYLLREDIDPVTPLALKLDGFDVVMEPNVRTRAWQTIDEFAHGQESWGLDEHRRMLKQLTKMKFNRVTLVVHPWQPFVAYEADGVRKRTAVLWHGTEFRVDGDTPGKVAFRGASRFENADLAEKSTAEDRTRAGIALAQGIVSEAHRLGMQAAISLSPLEFPREFASLLTGAHASPGRHRLSVVPSGDEPDGGRLKTLITTKIRAYLETYPTVDALELRLPAVSEWDEHAPKAWQRLDGRYDLGGPTVLEKLLEAVRKQEPADSLPEAERTLRSNVVALALLQPVLADNNLLKRPDGSPVELVVADVDPALGAVLKRILPSGTVVRYTVSNASARLAENREFLESSPFGNVVNRLSIALTDDDAGVLAQSALRRTEQAIHEIRRLRWDGFSARCRGLGELDPTVHYLSRAAFDESVTARSAHDDLFVTLTGKPAAADRLWLAFGHIEEATELINKHAPGFAFPADGMLLQHARAEPVPEWWSELIDHASQAVVEFYRSRAAAHPRTRPFLYYYAKRSEYVLSYLNSVRAVRESALAHENGDPEAALEKIETAIEALHDAINIVGDVVQSRDDLGLMAVLAAHAYRPLMAEYERQLDAAEAE